MKKIGKYGILFILCMGLSACAGKQTKPGNLSAAETTASLESPESAGKEPETFSEKKYGLEQYLTVNLPEGTQMSAYQTDIGIDNCQGVLLKGDFEEAAHGEYTPASWYSPGGIGIIDMADTFSFEEGKLTAAWLHMNHMGMTEEPEKIEGCEKQALLYEITLDLFTAAEWDKYITEYGEDSAEPVSNFWMVFLGEETDEKGCILFLNQAYFTKEDMTAFAQSVKFQD